MTGWQDISTAPSEDEARTILLWDGIGICIGRRRMHDGQIEGFAPDGDRVSHFTHWALPTYPQFADAPNSLERTV